MSDNELQRAVLDELDWDPRVNAGQIGVTAHGGVVTLTGHVGSFTQKLAAEQAASRVKNVRAVANDIEVKLPDQLRQSDETIAERALQVLQWDTALPKDSVKVVVDRGWVTLNGMVEWEYQRSAAEHDVHKIQGVIGVRNLIGVHPKPRTGVIREQITAALRRNAEIDASTIVVSAEGGRVVLDGRVHSVFERRLAEQAAWSAPGVTHVDDRISVQ